MERSSLNNWFIDTDGETRWYSEEFSTLYLPYNLEPEDYGDTVKAMIQSGYVVQLEII